MIELLTITRSRFSFDLKEWVDYHLAIGFDKITIYDNESLFSVEELFKSYKNVDVVFLKGQYGFNHTGVSNVFALLRSFFSNKKGKTTWCGLFDDDEFLYIKDSMRLQEVLDDSSPIHPFHWKYISLPNLIKDRTTTQIDTFNYVAPHKTPLGNRVHIKTLFNLKEANKLEWNSVHYPVINDIHYFTTDSYPLQENYYKDHKAVLYHYYNKSLQDMLWKKNRNNEVNSYAGLSETVFLENATMYTEIDNSMIERKKELGI